MSCPLPALRLLPWADALVWPRPTRSRPPTSGQRGWRAGSGSAWQAEATTAGASSATVRCPEVRVEATKSPTRARRPAVGWPAPGPAVPGWTPRAAPPGGRGAPAPGGGCVVAFELGDPALQVAVCGPQLATLGAPGARGAPGEPQQQHTQQAEPGGDHQQLALGEAGNRLVEDGDGAGAGVGEDGVAD